MASDIEFVEYVCEQISASGIVSYRKMFGDYAIYCEGKVVGLICNNQLFIKPTDAGRDFIGDVVEGRPYPGAKCYFLIEDELDDSEWISSLVSVTEGELSLPEIKCKKK